MGDTIRVDVDELAVIADRLRGMVLDIDRLGDELRTTWHHLPEGVEKEMYLELEKLRRAMAQIADRTGETAVHVMQAAEDFAGCEHAAGKRFMELDMGYWGERTTVSGGKSDKKTR